MKSFFLRFLDHVKGREKERIFSLLLSLGFVMLSENSLEMYITLLNLHYNTV